MSMQGRIRTLTSIVCAAFTPGALAGPPDLSPIEFLPGDDQIGPAIQLQEYVVIEPGGPGYLAVWQDMRAVLDGNINSPGSETSGNMLDIYGQLLDEAGNPVGPPIIVTNAGHNQRLADLAWNETAQAWFVAFESEQPDWYFFDNVYGVRVAADGTVLDEEPILLIPFENNQGAYYPSVASDGVNWLVIAQQWYGDPSTQRTVRGVRVAPDGSLVDPQPVVMNQANSLIYPDLAFADGVYLVVREHTSQGMVYGQRFDTALNPLGAPFSIGPGAGTSFAGSPRVASNGNRFMVVGRHAFRVESDGTNLDPGGIDLGGSAMAGYLDVGWTGSEWIASMALTIDFTQTSIYVQRIANDGALIDQNPIEVEDVSNGFPQRRTAVAGRNGEAQVAYPARVGSNWSSIRTAHVESDSAVSGLQTLSVGLPKQSYVQLVNGPGNEMLAVYLGETEGEMRIMSQRITTSGTVIDSEPTVVHAVPLIATPPKVAWNGEVYLIVWSLDGDDTVGKRVSATNIVIDANLLLIAATPPAGEAYTAGAVGAAGSTFVVGIFHRINFHEPVRYVEFVRVEGTTGNVIDQEPVFVVGGFAQEMAGDSLGGKAILAWAQYGNHDSHTAYTQAMVVDANSGVTGPSRVSAQQGHEPDIAIAEDRALIVWHDDNTIHQDDVEGRFMFSDGSMPGAEFPISNAAEEQMFPAAGWDGEQFVVAWNDYRHIVSVQQPRSNIYLARVLDDGFVLDPSGVQVTDSELPEDLPAVGGGGGSAVIMFSMLNGVGGVPEIQRLAYRVLGEPSQQALLTDFTVALGTLLSGTLEDLVESDDSWVRARSQFGLTASEPNVVDLRVVAVTTVQDPQLIDLAVEGRLNQNGGTSKLRLRNWATNSFQQVHQYSIGSAEMIELVQGIDAANRVRQSDGRIELSIRQSVLVTFTASGFVSSTDWVEVAVH